MSRIALVLVALVLALAGVVLWWGPGSDSTPAEGGPSEAETVAADAPDAADAEDAEGTAESPAPSADAQVQSGPAASAGAPSEAASGQTPQQRAVIEAVETGEHQARLSMAVEPTPFDPSDLEAYLATAEPGRVYDTLRPGKNVPRLQVLNAQPVRLQPGEQVELRVQAVPDAPVSFTSNRGGAFAESRLNSVTVQADAQGLATATWIATPGTIAAAPVLVGSPRCSGTLDIIMYVDPGDEGQ